MFTIPDFIRLLSIEQGVVEMQTKELAHEDTLLQPQPSGNCMNWVLGHLLENQIKILELLGGEPPIGRDELTVYQTDSDRLTADGLDVWPLEKLLESHKTIHDLVAARLVEMNNEDFAREVIFRDRQTTLGWRLLFLHFHYTYHLGQLELLRQLAGRTEKII